MLTIKYKKLHENARPPLGSEGNAGYDLFALEDMFIPCGNRRLVKTGIAMEIPYGYYGHISDRSGMAYKAGAHCLGKIIDPSYRGDVGIIILNTDPDRTLIISAGDKIAQMIFKKYEEASFEEAETLEETNRGDKGYGSTGV